MPAKQNKFKDLREQLESVLEQKERSEELSHKMEEEHLRTIAAMQSRIEKLEGMCERDVSMFGLFINKKTVSNSLLDLVPCHNFYTSQF